MGEKAWVAVLLLFIPKLFYLVQEASQVDIHVFTDLGWCTGPQLCLNRKGLSTNCSHKGGSMKLSKKCWYAE